MITVIQPGYFTTIQDEGRFGYQAYGMPISGAMDRYAGRVANLLVGNRKEAAVIEMTAMGASFKFDAPQLVAVCGADMQGSVNGQSVCNWSSFVVPERRELRLGAVQRGYRTYLAIRGGVDVPVVLGSHSTYTRAQAGGYEGRTLRQGDVLYIGHGEAGGVLPRALSNSYIPDYSTEINLRVLLGPQDDLFPSSSLQTFFTSNYEVTKRLDRMGYWLQGPQVIPHCTTDIVSDAMCPGAIQIPSNGMPFVMTADHQTTGGFAKIGSVIGADLSKLAQGRPGDTVHFIRVTEAVAVEALRQEQQCYAQISALCRSC